MRRILVFLLAAFAIAAIPSVGQSVPSVRTILQRYDLWRFGYVELYTVYWDENMVKTMNTVMRPSVPMQKYYVVTNRHTATAPRNIIAVLGVASTTDTTRVRADLTPPSATWLAADIAPLRWPDARSTTTLSEFLLSEIALLHLSTVSMDLQDLRDLGMPWAYVPSTPMVASIRTDVRSTFDALVIPDTAVVHRMQRFDTVDARQRSRITTWLRASKLFTPQELKQPHVYFGLPALPPATSPRILFVAVGDRAVRILADEGRVR